MSRSPAKPKEGSTPSNIESKTQVILVNELFTDILRQRDSSLICVHLFCEQNKSKICHHICDFRCWNMLLRKQKLAMKLWLQHVRVCLPVFPAVEERCRVLPSDNHLTSLCKSRSRWSADSSSVQIKRWSSFWQQMSHSFLFCHRLSRHARRPACSLSQSVILY